MACTETYTHFGDTIVCDIEGEHETLLFPEGFVQHFGMWTNPEGNHGSDCPCSRSPECWNTIGPLDVRIGWGVEVEPEETV